MKLQSNINNIINNNTLANEQCKIECELIDLEIKTDKIGRKKCNAILKDLKTGDLIKGHISTRGKEFSKWSLEFSYIKIYTNQALVTIVGTPYSSKYSGDMNLKKCNIKSMIPFE